MVNGASPFTIRVAGTDPTPMNTRKAVPMASAPRRWIRLVSSSMRPTPSTTVSELSSVMSNVFGTVHL